MRFTVIGCSGSMPGPASPASCYLVQAEHEGRTWSIALDLGNGSTGPMRSFLDPIDLDAVVLSHLHPDHCLDVCSLYVAINYTPGRSRESRMPVYAPPGAHERLGRAYGVEQPENLDGRYEFVDLVARRPFTVGPFTITPVPVFHPVEAYGLRVEADGAVLAYTGDTDICPELSELCADADLVLADCAYVDGRDDSEGVHMSGSKCARAALDAGGVKRLMLTHIPAWNDPEVCRAQAAAIWPGDVEIARPLATYDL
ncbi:MBL fold metallo-hydrolase [Mobilicoccus massiliensis]|uniref:MBL fold metallo-hydrolase n=1 Tax=Mobilicoccus massiliensis TaxID=1522310 RepID=UPI00058D1378|nr:MBL fold metallo-hydrolase [Mobilicoccus massiliensis]